MSEYEVIIHRMRLPPGATGAWLLRLYNGYGQHIYSTAGGVSLGVGLREVERAIEDDQLRLAMRDALRALSDDNGATAAAILDAALHPEGPA